jgi:hypothetical protein
MYHSLLTHSSVDGHLGFFQLSEIIGWGEREGAEWVVREGVGAGGRNEPSLEKKIKKKINKHAINKDTQKKEIITHFRFF